MEGGGARADYELLNSQDGDERESDRSEREPLNLAEDDGNGEEQEV